MGLALQPSLRPWAPWQRRVAVAAAAIVAVVAIGIFARPARSPVIVLDGRDGPDYLHTAERLIDSARHRVWLMVFVIHPGHDGDGPVDHLLGRLIAARQRGVDVRVVLDYGREWGTDIIDPKHERAAAILRRGEVPVLLDEIDRTTHAKILLVDDGDALLGSHNWTGSALRRNREVSLHLREPAVIARLAGFIAEVPGFADLGHGQSPPDTSPTQR